MAYLFWSAAYAAFGYFVWGDFTAPAELLNSALQSYCHLWFLPVLTGLYIITPLLRQISAKPETERYFLLLFLIFGVGLTTLLMFDIPYAWWLQTVVVVEMVTGYAGYFVLGRYLFSHDFSQRFRTTAYALGALGIAACIVVCSVYSVQTKQPDARLYGFLSLTTFLSASGMLLFFKYQVSRWRWPYKAQRFIRGLSACTFGAYLIHPFFLRTLYDAGIHALTFNPAAADPLLTLPVFVVSVAVSWLIRRIPVVHRYIT